MFLSELLEFSSARCLAGGKKLGDSSEIARVPDMLPSLFPSWSVANSYGRGGGGKHFFFFVERNPLFKRGVIFFFTF